MPLSQGNIGHCDVALFNAISNLNRFEEGTENPRVGGSIPPLAIQNQYVVDARKSRLSRGNTLATLFVS
jgi:hypothetical protein